MTTYNFLARIADEGDLAASAHEVLDLLYATGGAHDAELRVWEIASHPGRWRAQVNHSRHYGDWHDTDSPEACIASVRASLPANAVDRLAELRRRHERDFDAVGRLFAVLRGAGNVRDVGARIEAHVARMVLRAQPWSVTLEWRPMLDVVGRRERANTNIHATFGDCGARLDGVAVPDYLTVASTHELAARLAHVARTLDAATAALTVEHGGNDGR